MCVFSVAGDACNELLAADGLSLPQMDAQQIGVKLQGSLRPLIARAEDLSLARSEARTDTGAAQSIAHVNQSAVAESAEHDVASRDDVVVSFRLQPGSYALEAMRELMKRPQ